MKPIMITFCYFLLIATLFGYATFLIYHQINGWGWLLFATVLCIDNIKVSVDEKCSNKVQ